jgi:KipI family sensor histidine kinase inhibitor
MVDLGCQGAPARPPQWVEAGDQGFLCVLAERIDPAANTTAQALARAIRAAGIPGVSGVVPGYASVLVEYDGPAAGRRAALAAVQRAGAVAAGATHRRFRIPVLYGGDAGPDLEEVAQRLGLTAAEVVALHAGRPYRIFCLGFAPGFPLAGVLDPRLELPRRDAPRARVPPGSVAIAGRQTGIYPTASPGGWHLLGRTPLTLFRPERVPPVVWGPGDSIVFDAVDARVFDRLAALGPDHRDADPRAEVFDGVP